MSRQLKVEGEQGRINSILRSAVKVAEDIYSFTNHKDGYFALVIKSEVVPPDWADAAFKLRARRHDTGYGENAMSIWIFPVHMASDINSKFPILISALARQRPPLLAPAFSIVQSNRAPSSDMAFA